LFHFKEAIRRKMGKLGLLSLYSSNPTMNYMVNLMFALVFVPLSRLEDVYGSVVVSFLEAHREEGGLVEQFEAIEDLFEYFQKTWMGKQVQELGLYNFLLVSSINYIYTDTFVLL
jgi:hypothetical protein